MKARRLLWAAGGYDVIVTSSAPVSVWYGLFHALGLRRPGAKHVAVEFFTGPPRRWFMIALWPLLRAVMRWSLDSAYAIMVHSFAETAIYQDFYGLRNPIMVFAPFGGDPKLLTRPTTYDGAVLAAGRDSRDFHSFIQAVRGTGVSAAIIAPKGSFLHVRLPDNITLYEDISRDAYIGLLAEAQLVVVPLQNKARSVGQVVLTNAMALGKAVIATRTIGTVDYIAHGKTGMLVPPYDVPALREAILCLITDEDARQRLGTAAREAARRFYECHLKALQLVIDSAVDARTMPTRSHLAAPPPVATLDPEI
jgi:glycosyltransferase involved in cell wall biosynthesis